jgi:glycosyltransferase involved in cell wall biosynthesis
MFDPFDERALCAAMARVIDDEGLRAELRSRGLVRARMFDWRETARLTLAAYQLAVSEGRKTRMKAKR